MKMIGTQFPSARQANYTLAVLVLAYGFSLLDRQVLSLLVDTTLHISDFQMSLVQGMAFAVFYAAFGRLTDKFNRKIIIMSAIILWCLMTAACGFAQTLTALFLARVGVAVG